MMVIPVLPGNTDGEVSPESTRQGGHADGESGEHEGEAEEEEEGHHQARHEALVPHHHTLRGQKREHFLRQQIGEATVEGRGFQGRGGNAAAVGVHLREK